MPTQLDSSGHRKTTTSPSLVPEHASGTHHYDSHMEPPLWKKTYDAVEEQVAPPLQKALANPDVIDAITLGRAVQKRARDDMATFIKRQLHAANLPSGTDVRDVSKQIAGLERQIRLLNKRLDGFEAKIDALEPKGDEDE